MIIVKSIISSIFIFIVGYYLYGGFEIKGTDGGIVIIEDILYGVPTSIIIGIIIGVIIKSKINNKSKRLSK